MKRRIIIRPRIDPVPAPWPTDARPRDLDDDERALRQPDPDADRRRRRRRRVTGLLLGLVFVAGTITAVLGQGGYVDVWRLRHQQTRLEGEVASARAEVEALRAKLDAVEHDPAARERIARERLGYARPGEKVFVLPPEPEADPAP